MRIRLVLLIFVAFCCINSEAQIVIEAKDFNLSTLDDIYGVDSNFGIAPPFGTGKSWDFGNLIISKREIVVNDTARDPFFSDAFRFQNTTIGLDTFTALARFYHEKDTSIYREIGIASIPKTYSLFAQTGASGDSIHLLTGKSRLDGHILKFPLKFNDNWSTSYRSEIPFTLTVQALSHVKVPYKLISNVQDQSIVRGTGILTLPDGSGSTRQMNATLIQRTVFSYDSIYQGLKPASPIIMGAIGMAQGQRRIDLTYSFYVKGFNQPQLILTIDTATNRLLRSKFYLESTTGIKWMEEQKQEINIYPNPCSAGIMNIKSKAFIDSNTKLSIYDINGKTVFEKELMRSSTSMKTINISHILNGEYLLLLHNQDGVVSWSKLIISK